jgi:hypothetical protein
MSAAFDHLKKILDEKSKLTNEEVEVAIKEHGEMTDEEKIELEAVRHEKERSSDATITMEQYLEATQVLDTVAEGSDEYKKAEAIVEKFESGM